MELKIKQYDIFWVDLNPTIGVEINKVRPCVIVSPDEINRNVDTIIVAPISSKGTSLPTRLKIQSGNKKQFVVLHQIRAIDKRRLKQYIGALHFNEIYKLKQIIREMLVD